MKLEAKMIFLSLKSAWPEIGTAQAKLVIQYCHSHHLVQYHYYYQHHKDRIGDSFHWATVFTAGRDLHFLCYSPPPSTKNWGKLFGGTVPPNNTLFGGTVPPNNTLFGRTVPPNSTLFGGTPDSEKWYLIQCKVLNFMNAGMQVRRYACK